MAQEDDNKRKGPGFLSRLLCRFSSKKAETNELTEPLETEAPATVYFQGQKLRFGMEPQDNTLVLKAKVPELDNAATRIQSAFRRFKARALYEQMKALQSMNLEVTWPAGSPFIGILIVRIRTITDMSAVKHPILRAKCDGDQTINVPGGRDEYGIVRYDDRATFCFVIVRSSTVVTIEVLQSLELATRIMGRVKLPVSNLPQGVHDREAKMLSPAGKEVATMKMTVGYQWARDTQDFGGYEGAQFVLLPTRKFRGARADKVVERLWKVNHWLCSHDNLWCTTLSFANLVKLAVERKREEEELAIMNSSGVWEAAPVAVVPELKREISKAKSVDMEAGAQELDLQSTATLLMRVLGSEQGPKTWGSFDASSRSDSDPLGMEDWHQAMFELTETPMRDEFDESCRFDSISSEMVAQLDKAEEENGEDDGFVSSSLESSTRTGASEESSSSKQETKDMAGSPGKESKPLGSEEAVEKLTAKKHLTSREKKNAQKAAVTGKFEYGAYRPASKRGVHIFMRRAEHAVDTTTPKPVYLGCRETNRAGRLRFDLPDRFLYTPGHYQVLALLPDDNTYGRGSMFMLEPGTQCVVFDLDGTITTSDAHVVAQVLLDSVSVSTVIGSSLGRSYDLKQRANALTVCRAWAAKGYQVVYLSGRQGSAYNMTAQWLIKHGYPPGPIHLTRTHLPTLPVYVSVGHFKVKYMKEMISKGLEITAAYGNTGTDVKAYERAGIPKNCTFIVGPHGGKHNTVKVKDFTSHLIDVLKFPNARKPIPYTELLFNSPEQT
eukprot:evm.model.scf_1770.2 EVM.evm.TU.scf_1770.2   scf_1770:2991-11514(-)